MPKLADFHALPEKLQEILGLWNGETKSEILSSDGANAFFLGVETLADLLREELKSSAEVDPAKFFDAFFKVCRKTIAGDVQEVKKVIRRRKRKVGAQTMTFTNSVRAVQFEMMLREVLASRQKTLDDGQETGHSQVVKDERKAISKIAIKEVFGKVSVEELAALPSASLQKIEDLVSAARQIQVKQLIGLKPKQSITAQRINRFLIESANRDFSDAEMQQVAALVQQFRNAGNRLVLDGQECVLTSAFSSDRGHRRFVLLSPGRGGKAITARNRLPEGLRFEN